MTFTQIEQLYNSGKSLPVKKAIKILQESGFDVEYSTFTGYKDKKSPGARFVYSRKVVNFWSVKITKEGNVVAEFNSERSPYTSYSLTRFVLNNCKIPSK